MFNISYRKVGGIRFLKLGAITLTLCTSSAYKPVKGTGPQANAARHLRTAATTLGKVQGKFILDL